METSKKLTFYIAGPMRGLPYFNFPAFDEAALQLRNQGFEVISPAEMDRHIGFDPETLGPDYDWNDLNKCNFSLMDAIDRDVAALKKCDAIFMLRGWEKSKGAKAEKALAEWIGLVVSYQEEIDVLEEALTITKGDRNASYGPPDADFKRTAQMWSAIKGIEFKAYEVAIFMIAVKLSREAHQRKRDNAVDIAGYARCLSLCRDD